MSGWTAPALCWYCAGYANIRTIEEGLATKSWSRKKFRGAHRHSEHQSMSAGCPVTCKTCVLNRMRGPMYLALRCGDISWGFVSYPQTSPFIVFCTCLTAMPAPMFPIQSCFPLSQHLPSGAALVPLQMIHLSFHFPPWAAGKLSHLEALSPWSPRCWPKPCHGLSGFASYEYFCMLGRLLSLVEHINIWVGGCSVFLLPCCFIILSVLPPFGGGWTQLLVLW